jgi:hypothetical protein
MSEMIWHVPVCHCLLSVCRVSYSWPDLPRLLKSRSPDNKPRDWGGGRGGAEPWQLSAVCLCTQALYWPAGS